MDPTLRQILQRLYELSVAYDQQQQRIAELEQTGQQQLAELQARVTMAESQSLPSGWRLVRDT